MNAFSQPLLETSLSSLHPPSAPPPSLNTVTVKLITASFAFLRRKSSSPSSSGTVSSKSRKLVSRYDSSPPPERRFLIFNLIYKKFGRGTKKQERAREIVRNPRGFVASPREYLSELEPRRMGFALRGKKRERRSAKSQPDFLSRRDLIIPPRLAFVNSTIIINDDVRERVAVWPSRCSSSHLPPSLFLALPVCLSLSLSLFLSFPFHFHHHGRECKLITLRVFS